MQLRQAFALTRVEVQNIIHDHFDKLGYMDLEVVLSTDATRDKPAYIVHTPAQILDYSTANHKEIL